VGYDQVGSGKNRMHRGDAEDMGPPVDTGKRSGLSTSELGRIKELEKENRELRGANEILRLASAFFAKAEFDRKQR
jgi:transposase-like protein